MIDVFDFPPDMEQFDLSLVTTQAIDASFDDEILGGDSFSLLETSNGEIQVPIKEWFNN